MSTSTEDFLRFKDGNDQNDFSNMLDLDPDASSVRA